MYLRASATESAVSPTFVHYRKFWKSLHHTMMRRGQRLLPDGDCGLCQGGSLRHRQLPRKVVLY